MKPVELLDVDGRKRALADYHKDLHRHGLATRSYDEIEEFIYGPSEVDFPNLGA
jgi:hypothetical protein